MKFSFGRIAIAAAALMAVVYGAVEFRGPGGYAGWMEKRAQLRTLQQENAKLRSDIDRLGRTVDRLQNDPGTRELAARKILGKVGATDKVYKIPASPKPAIASSTN